MIILHNSFDAESRAFVEANKNVPGVEVYDWYNGGRELFWKRTGTREVSAFPSVVVLVPEHETDKDDKDNNVPRRQVPEHQEVIRKPLNKAKVDARVADINKQIKRSKELGKHAHYVDLKTPLKIT